MTCRTLGYRLGLPDTSPIYGTARIGEQFWRSNLQCNGNEKRLQDCPGRENPSCARGEVAGVVCGGQLDWVIPPTRAATVNLPRLSSPVIHVDTINRQIDVEQPSSETPLGKGSTKKKRFLSGIARIT